MTQETDRQVTFSFNGSIARCCCYCCCADVVVDVDVVIVVAVVVLLISAISVLFHCLSLVVHNQLL